MSGSSIQFVYLFAPAVKKNKSSWHSEFKSIFINDTIIPIGKATVIIIIIIC